MAGEDGFPAEWYKQFKELIISQLRICFNHVLAGGKTPPSWKRAIISIIPKPGKDRTTCGSYRPISVLNIDYRLFASILARRLEQITPELIDTDQTGFIKNRQTYDNIRRALHVIDMMKSQKSVAISLDAEKAFDSVNWNYLYLVLSRFGFNNQIVNCLKSLYDSPSARIKINGDLSSILNLERGCRQGCPLNPTLFALFIEPLAQAIREQKDIRGITIGDSTYKVGLYADDILITLSNPNVSLPNLFTLLKKFGMFSGYKLNLQKTQSLSFNYNPQKEIQKMFTFNWGNNIIKYLGIYIPGDLKRLYEINYTRLTSEIKADIQRWSLLPMNLYNRIDMIKMNLLPRFLYLFQSLPVNIPPKQFNEWNRMISKFIWAKLKPRIKLQTLQIGKEYGGLQVPCLENYYKAAQLRWLIGWSDPSNETKWREIDQSFFNTPLQSLLGDYPLLKKHLSMQQLPTWISLPLETWFKILKDKNIEKGARILRWPVYDTEFIPANIDKGFKQWLHKGITGYWKISEKNILKSYKQLQETYGLGKQDFFRFLQLRDYFDKHIKPTNKKQEEIDLIKIFVDSSKGNTIKKQISRLYSSLQITRNLSTTCVKVRWEKEAEVVISDDDWLNICKNAMTTSCSSMWREFTWKNIIRFFITPNISSKHQNKPDEARCWRDCGNKRAGPFHVFWNCDKIRPYWSEVIRTINNITGLGLPNDFTVIYLGNLPQDVQHSKKYLCLILLAGARKAITRKWLSKDPPTSSDWMIIVKDIYLMERLTFTLRLKTNSFFTYWESWTDYISQNNI
uniref:Reverse transcriptase domain-containing protein n=1 Tax=Oryzias melastigma TaxID=30732 RepID=A0A3B3D4V0_ORYME